MTKKKIYLAGILTFIFFFHCSMIRMGSLFLAGSLKQENFLKKVPILYKGGLIFLKVRINDAPEEYNFILDTGAAFNVISSKIARRFKISEITSSTISDSTKRKEEIQFSRIPKLSLAGVPFVNTAAAIFDLDRSSHLGCYKIDGVLGVNLITLVPFWSIDYQNQVLTFGDQKPSVKGKGKKIVIPFSKSIQRIPQINLKIYRRLELECKVDLGSTRGFMSDLETWKKIQRSKEKIAFVRGYGESSEGALGTDRGTYVLAKIEQIEAGGIKLDPVFFAFANKAYTSVGNRYFDQYILTMDWADKVFILQVPNSEDIKPLILEDYGFSFNYNKQIKGIVISFLYEHSSAEKAGLKLGDVIEVINGRFLNNISEEQFCDLYFNYQEILTGSPLTITINRQGSKVEFKLHKSLLLE